jgi:hypothetical protein
MKGSLLFSMVVAAPMSKRSSLFSVGATAVMSKGSSLLSVGAATPMLKGSSIFYKSGKIYFKAILKCLAAPLFMCIFFRAATVGFTIHRVIMARRFLP